MSDQKALSRRSVVVGSAASVAGIGAATTAIKHNRAVFAQNNPGATPGSTPNATPGIHPNGTPDVAPLPPGPPADVILGGSDWPTAYGNYQGYRTAKTTIDSSNVTTLGPAWRNNLTNEAGAVAATGAPLVIGDTIYFSDMNNNIYAVDRATGQPKWTKTYNIPTNGPNGVAYGYGNIYSGLGESAQVVALNAESSEEVWRVQLSNMSEEGIRMAPVVYGGIVYISIVPLSTNNNPGSRGILHALDAQTGNTIWYFDLCVDNLWGNARKNMGAGLWYPPNFDEQGNLYFGNGNAAPWPGDEQFPEGSSRKNANLYASTAMSIDPTIGAVRWSFQPKPFDLFDLDYQIAPVVVNLDINGEMTKVAICSGKTGDVVAINADEGTRIWWTKVGKHLNDQLQQLPYDRGVRVFPGGNGGVLTPPAFADNVFYCVVTNRPSWVSATGTWRDHPEEHYEGEVIAIDAATGNILWDTYVPTFPTGSIVVANDLVITAGLDGLVRAFRRDNGTQVWNFQVGAGVNAPVVIAGDELIVTAATKLSASPEQFGGGDVPQATYEMVSFRLGIGGGFVPEATPTATNATPDTSASNPESTPDTGVNKELSSPATPVSGATGLTLALEAVDIAFHPNNLSIPANTPVVVTITNTGALQHDFKIDNPEVYSGMIPSGKSAQVTLNLPAGTYQFYCTVEGHAEAGMIGQIIAA